jgi:MYXO-CTERM domain-containing protein
MPTCDQTASGGSSCASDTPTTFTGQGLEFARKVIAGYKQDHAPFTTDDGTRYVNVLITDGQTSEGSTSVQESLEAMVREGIDTYVIGFGSGDELDRDQLETYAGWGNTEHAIVVDPAEEGSSNALATALEGVVSSLGLDSCCVLNSCASTPEPADPRAVCGDGRVEGDEACDDGKRNATYGACGGRCDGPHLRCGDSRVDGPEKCDDGNTEPGDGCNASCQLEDEEDGGTAGPTAGAAASGAAGTGPRPYDAGLIQAGSASRPRVDAGSPESPAPEPDGCDCSVPGSTSSGARPLATMLFGLALLLSRTHRRRRP